MERTELINKINDYDYMRKLIMENFTADNYRYCSELSELMQEIEKYSDKASIYGNVPLRKDDYKLFLDGTIARLFKESISRKDALKGNETNKLSQMAFLPDTIAAPFFSQEDMREVLFHADSIAIHHLISTGGPVIGTIVSSQLLLKSKKMDYDLDEEKIRYRRLESELEDLREKRREVGRDDPNFDQIRLEEINTRREYEEQGSVVHEITSKKDDLSTQAAYTIEHAAELFVREEKNGFEERKENNGMFYPDKKREELIGKITDYYYMRNLIMQNPPNDDYSYPSELSELIHEISKYSADSILGNQPLDRDAYKLFLDGSISKMFKESISRNQTNKIFELKKMSQLSNLPKEVSTELFMQDDMIDAMLLCRGDVFYSICASNPQNCVAIASKLFERKKQLEESLYEEYDKKGEIMRKIEEKKEIEVTEEQKEIVKQELRSLKKLLSMQERKIEDIKSEMWSLESRSTEILEYAQTSLVQKQKYILEEQEYKQEQSQLYGGPSL